MSYVQFPAIRSWLSHGWAWLVLGLLLLATYCGWLAANHHADSQDRARFQARAHEIEALLRSRLQRLEGLLLGARSFVQCSDDITWRDWRNYARSARLSSEHDLPCGLALVERVERTSAAAFLERMQLVAPAFRLHGVGDIGDHLVVTFAAEGRQGGNTSGFDLGSNPDVAEILQRARRGTAFEIVSGMELPHDAFGSADVLACLPLVEPFAGRRAKPRESVPDGWVVAFLHSRHLFGGIEPHGNDGLRVEVFRGSRPLPEARLHDNLSAGETAVSEEPGSTPLEMVRLLRAGDQDFSVRFSPTPEFNAQRDRWLGWLVLAGGLALSLLGFGLLASLAATGSRAAELAARMTESLKAHEAESRRLALVAQRTDNAVVLTDAAGRIEWVNEGFTRITGYTADEVLGRKPGSFLQGPDTDLATVATMRDCLARGEGFQVEIVNYGKTGRRYWLAIEVQPIREGDRLTGFLAIESDITERKHSEQLLRASQDRLRRITNAVLGAVFQSELQPDGQQRFLFLSRGAEEIFGHTCEELLADFNLAWGQIHPNDLPRVAASIQQAVVFQEAWTCEARLASPGQPVRWIRGTALPEPASAHGTQIWNGILLDITEQKRIEETLRDSEQRFRSAAEVASDVIYQWDLTTDQIEYFGPVDALLRYSNRSFPRTAEGWEQTIHEEDRPRVLLAVENQIKHRHPFSEEYRLRCEDHSWLHVHDRGQVLCDADGVPRVWIGALCDISARKRDEAFQHEQQHVLELIARGAELPYVLRQVTRLAELHNPELACAILVVDSAAGRLWCGASNRLPAEFASRVEGTEIAAEAAVGGFLSQAIRRDQRVLANDLAAAATHELDRWMADSQGWGACWVQPIATGAGRMLGALALYSRQPRAPESGESYLIETLARLAGIAIERVEWDQRVTAHARRQAVIAELGSLALSATVVDQLFDSAVRQAAQTLNLDNCLLVEFDATSPRASVGPHAALIAEMLFDGGPRSLAARAVKQGEPLVIDHLAAVGEIPALARLTEAGVASGLCVVVQGHTGSIGVLTSWATRPRSFAEEEVHFFQSVAHVLADAIDRQRSEQSLRQHLVELAEARSLLEQQTAILQTRNEQLRDAQQRADTANRAKSQFLANMSHEIRTPMTAILGYTDLLLHAEDEAEIDRRAALETVRRNGEHLLQIINDILDLSKIEAGRVELEIIQCSPMQVVGDVVEVMQVRAAEKGLPLSVACLSRLPELIHTDPTRLRQILLNLVGNAVKFTSTGSVRIVVRMLDDNGLPPRIEFSVVDTGVGITDEQLSRLFRPFTQADSSTTRQFGGTGLGLTISKHLIEILGGAIDVESQPGEGSTFRVTLPTSSLAGVRLRDYSNADASAGFSQTPADGPSGGSAPQRVRLPCRVLLAEDGPDNQRLLSVILRKAGAEVVLAENGQVAVEQALTATAEGQPFDIILMDMQMPVLDGYAATTQLRTAGYRGPILALTAHAMAGDRQRCLDAGCDDYATKPIDRQALLQKLQHWSAMAEQPAG